MWQLPDYIIASYMSDDDAGYISCCVARCLMAGVKSRAILFDLIFRGGWKHSHLIRYRFVQLDALQWVEATVTLYSVLYFLFDRLPDF